MVRVDALICYVARRNVKVPVVMSKTWRHGDMPSARRNAYCRERLFVAAQIGELRMYCAGLCWNCAGKDMLHVFLDASAFQNE